MNIALDPIAQQLDDLGYHSTEVASTSHSDSRAHRVFEIMSFRPLLAADGTRKDYVTPRNLAVVTLTYASHAWPETFSPIAKRLPDALAQSLVSTGALVRRTGRCVQAVFRHDDTLAVRLSNESGELYPHGVQARDQNSVLTLCAGCSSIPIGDDAVWIGGRSPLTVARDDLPLFDADAVSATPVHHPGEAHSG